MKPVVFYVDDEPHNLTVFEVSMPEEWKVMTFDNPMAAIEALEKESPAVIISDQRMPGMSGVQFLELARKLRPYAIRVIVTGYSDEELVVESVRRARIFDYLKKPWDADEITNSIQRAIDFYQNNEKARTLQEELEKREAELSAQNADLQALAKDLEIAKFTEQAMRAELECWVPPFVMWALQNKKIQFPVRRDLVGITFDIVGSSQLHGVTVNGRPLRSQIIQIFSESIIRHGGWRESHSGDSAYGHFGLLEDGLNPFEAAMAVSREFRVALRSLAEVHGIQVECGISMHLAKDCLVDIHTVQLNTPRGLVVQKSFDTTSTDVDLLHRMEKLVHLLPGSNIILSESFLEQLRTRPAQLIDIGEFLLAGQAAPSRFFILPSDRVRPEHLEALQGKNKVVQLVASDEEPERQSA